MNSILSITVRDVLIENKTKKNLIKKLKEASYNGYIEFPYVETIELQYFPWQDYFWKDLRRLSSLDMNRVYCVYNRMTNDIRYFYNNEEWII